MKNFKKILIVILVATLLFAGCMVAAFADGEYTGTLEELTSLVEKAEKAVGVSKQAAIIAVYDYLDKTPVDPATEGYDAVIARAEAQLVAGIESNLSFAGAATVDANAAYTGIFNAKELLAIAEATLAEDNADLASLKTKYDDALLKAAEALLGKVDKDILTTLKTAQNRVAINKLRRVLQDCAPYGEVNLNDIWGHLVNLEADHNKATVINLNALEENNSISDYDLPIYLQDDMEQLPVGNVTKSGKVGTTWNFAIKNTKNPLGIHEESNGNRYIYAGYAPTTETDKNTYVQLDLSSYKPDNGYVMEFDFTTFDSLPTAGLKLEAGGFDMADGRGFPPFFLHVDANGNLIMGDAPNTSDQNKVTALSNAIVPGQWIHIVIVFDYSEFTYTLIIDGEKLSTTSAKYKGNSFDLSKGVIRFGSSCESGSVAVDNFVLYSGSGYRNPEKFNNMSDDEKFIYYANYLAKDSQDVNGKKYAYDIATEFLGAYWIWADEAAGTGSFTDYANGDEQLKAAVNIYLDFDIDELITKVKTDNLATFADMAAELDAISRNTETISERSTKILEIEAFVLKYAELIDKESDSDGDEILDYDAYNKIVATVKKEIALDQNAILFIRHMSRFKLVTALNAMQRYYERAKAIINAEDEYGRIDMDVILDENHPDRANFAELIAAYNEYIAAYDTIDDMIRQNNSAKIINCIGFINDYTTENEWIENYDYMNKYLELVKDTILGRELDGKLLYDPEYENVAECVDFFNTTYAFFYNVQQENHIKYISDIIELISDTEAYIEKMGMVAMIDRYVAANTLDYSDSRIISLLNELETCRAELQLREDDYGKILIQNAVYFINIVENMRTSTTYTEKKEYFNKASVYYFNIDITVAGAAEAAAIYEQCAREISLAEESSLAFIESVEFYTTCETADERYAALVDCYYNAQFAEKSYAGVTEALETFEAEYAAYMDYVNTANADVAAAGAAVGSLRSNCGVTTIIAIIIKKIFGI